MKFRCSAGAVAVAVAAGVASPALAQTGAGFYLGAGLGFNLAAGMRHVGTAHDGGSDCDEYINPLAPRDPGCAGQGTSDWESEVDGAGGILAAASLGYRLGGSGLRVEAEYFHRESAFNETAPAAAAGGATLAKLAGELQRAEDRIGSVTSNNLFGNVLYDFPVDGPVTPYVGFGVGFGVTALDYGSLLVRSHDPSRITTGAGRPNAAEIQRNLANTTSVARVELRDTLFSYQALFGASFALSEAVALDVKGRWVDYGTFADDAIVWDPLRSHPPNRRLDGSQPVSGELETADMRLFGVSLGLTYSF